MGSFYELFVKYSLNQCTSFDYKNKNILLVYMFDRLGRKDDETPFVVEWFVQNGIEVWSTMEGQQRFDTHVDKLMNYIRYWQASGESIKTSIRTKTRISQLTEAGYYTGGSVPFGYKLVDRGRTNKRNQRVQDLAVDEDEALIIRLIFQKYVTEGYGAQRLCRFLHDNGYQARNGHGFPNTTINRIIKNSLYIGILKNGDAIAPCNEELRIVDDETFMRAQEIMKERTQPHSAVPLNCKSRSLLVGHVYCAHCGNRLTLTTSSHMKKQEDGSYERDTRARYQCHFGVRHPGECDGQTVYSVEKLDAIVDKAILSVFAQMKNVSETELISDQHEKETALAKRRMEQAEKRMTDVQKELDDYRAETIKVIRGQSKLDSELLNSLIKETERKLQEADAEYQSAKEIYSDLLASANQLTSEYKRILSWADLYKDCSLDAKKMIVAQFIKGVYVGRDYRVAIQFNTSFESFRQFGQQMENIA